MLTQPQKTFILRHYKKASISFFCKELGISRSEVQKFVNELNGIKADLQPQRKNKNMWAGQDASNKKKNVVKKEKPKKQIEVKKKLLKPGPKASPLSLYPMSFESVLRIAMNCPTEGDEKQRQQWLADQEND